MTLTIITLDMMTLIIAIYNMKISMITLSIMTLDTEYCCAKCH